MDRLEEIRKRDELYNGQFTTIVYSDRRWLLGEVERLRARVSELEGYVTDQEYFLNTPEGEEE